MNDLYDLMKVWVLNLGTFGVVTLTDVEQVLKFILLIATLTYTVMKIISWFKKENTK